jgi:hypothetical protein
MFLGRHLWRHFSCLIEGRTHQFKFRMLLLHRGSHILVPHRLHQEPKEKSYWKLWLVGIFAALIIGSLHWGGYLLLAGDSVPEHVDAAVVLQGSIASENARTAAAMAFLQRGSANRVAISAPRESYWDQEIPPIARRTSKRNMGLSWPGEWISAIRSRT